MKQTIRILSYIGLAIATAAFIILFASGIPLPQSDKAIALAKPFNDFPVGEPQFIDFRLDEASFGQLTDREKQDQLRDWLLFTIASDKDLSAKEINESLYDLSTTRQGYMRPVSNFEYGTTRSVYVGDGEVVALIPAKLSAPERTDALAHIADKHRKDLGKKPTELLVFEYELDLAEQYGVLTRREVIDANRLFTAQDGYIESKVSTLNDLQSFMTTIDDLTYAQLTGDQLILGGRKIQARTYKNIRIEDVAAIWQARKGGFYGIGFSLDWDYKYKDMLQLLEAAQPVLQKLLYNQPLIWNEAIQSAKVGLQQKQVESYDKLVSQLRVFLITSVLVENQDLENIQSITQEEVQNSIQQSPIFSQFPLQKIESLTEEEFKNLLSLAILRSPSFSQLTPQEIESLFNEKDLGKLASQSPFASQLTKQESEILSVLTFSKSYGYQYARYDGNLQGTAVSMTLFYTDLLAKLWGFNLADSSPQEQIEGFVPWTQIKIPSIYKDELDELPYTRLWFEPDSNGFQLSGSSNVLLFTRNSTQVAARSSTSGQAGEEVAATYIDTTFIDWWNGHYEAA